MKFKIFKTNTTRTAKNCIEDLLAAVNPADIESPHILLVPDRASLAAERSLLRRIGGSFNVQVYTLSRYADLVAPQTLRPLTRKTALLEMLKILEQNADKLVCFAHARNTEGFAEKMLDAVSLLKYNRISPQQLREGNFDKSVGLKMSDVALVYEKYLIASAGKYLDSADKLEKLIEVLSDSPVVAKSTFYVYDFDNLSVQEEVVFENLARHSQGFYAACAVGEGYAYSNRFFHSLCKIASKVGGAEQVERKEYCNDFAAEREQALLFGKTVKQPTVCPEDRLTFACGADADAEVYSLAAFIDGYVRKGGRYRDVKVAVSNVEEYADAVRRYFAMFGIPYFLDEKFKLSNHALCRFVLDFFAMKRSNMQPDTVFNFVKNVFFGAEDRDVWLFENFCLKYNFGYDFSSFDLGASESDEVKEAAERVRQRLCRFASIPVPAAASISEYVAIARKFLDDNGLLELPAALAEKLEKESPDYYARFSVQVPKKLTAVLDELEQSAGELVVDTNKFQQFFLSAASAVRVSILPLFSDCVEVAGLEKSKRHDIKTLALLGANEGKMPAVKKDSALFNDNNLQKLLSAGVALSPNTLTVNGDQRCELYMLLLEPQDRLYVSYRMSDGEGSALKPASFVRALQKTHLRPDGTMPMPLFNPDFGTHSKAWADFKYMKERSFDGCVETVRKLPDCPPENFRFDYNPDLTLENGKELFFRFGTASVTRIEEFYKCPFKHFLAKGGLGLKEREVARLKPTELGTIVHDCLEKFVNRIIEKGTEGVSEKDMREIFDAVMEDDKYKAAQKNKISRHNLMRLKEEAVKTGNDVILQLKSSKFFPIDCEAKFGPHQKYASPVVEYNGLRLEFQGKIDRVDGCGEHFFVIDYKRGKAEFKDNELYTGVRLQLPVYIKVVRDALKSKPAGFYYKKLTNDFVNADAKEYGGKTLDDLTVAEKMDTDLAANGKSARLRLRKTSKGELSRQSGGLLSEQQMSAYVDYAWNMIGRAVGKMAEGIVAQSPFDGACKFCEFDNLCDFDDLSGRQCRKVKDVTPATIQSAVEGGDI